MSDKQSNSQAVTAGGIVGQHPTLAGPQALVAPTFEKHHNTIKSSLVPFACWRANDMRFDFDSSFVLPGIQEELVLLKALIDEHTLPGDDGRSKHKPPLTVFGHADPTGNEDYNKNLSGRRAQAIYAVLVRDVGLWDDLYSHPHGADQWEPDAIHTMQSFLGLPLSENPSSSQRRPLFKAYMDKICTILDDDKKPVLDAVGQPVMLKLEREDFLAQGKDKGGKADFQGCGEFNPVLIFSKAETAEFAAPEKKDQRDSENATNRRVLIFLFRPGLHIEPSVWPCPRAKEGVADCKKRFWSDAEKRLAPQELRRNAGENKDTFGCRFYDRLANNSPCEKSKVFGKRFRLQLCDHNGKALPGTLYVLEMDGGKISGHTDGDGFTRVHTCTLGKASLTFKDFVYQLTFDPEFEDSMTRAQSILNALGFNAGPLDGIKDRRTEDALRAYQRERKLPVTGNLDDATKQALLKEHVLKEI